MLEVLQVMVNACLSPTRHVIWDAVQSAGVEIHQ